MQIRRQVFSQVITGPDDTDYKLASTDDCPNNILEEIVWQKEREVIHMAAQLPLADLVQQSAKAPPIRDFVAAINQAAKESGLVGLIAEVKRASPSKGIIREDFNPVEIAQSYEKGGAACLSVLTDRSFFKGSFNYLWQVRYQVNIPLLCKEFVISPYQVWLARNSGADAVLLIAAVLSDRDLKTLSQLVRTLGMRSLIEVHTLTELDRVLALDHLDLVGINNRNLEDFSVDLATTQQLLSARKEQLAGVIVVSESGIRTPRDLAVVADAGARAVLVGESLVKQADVEQATRALLSPVDVMSVV